MHKISQRVHPDEVQRLVVAYQAGISAAELARQHDLAKSTVLKLLTEAGVKRRYPRFTPEETALVCELYRQGVTQVEIGRQLGRHPGAVWHVLRRGGLV